MRMDPKRLSFPQELSGNRGQHQMHWPCPVAHQARTQPRRNSMTTALHSHHSTNPGETRPWGRLRRSAAVAVIVAGAFVFPSTAAAAAETDLLKVIDTNVDFGGSSGLSATNLGVPLSSATAVWTSSPGFVSVKLTGAVYYDGPRTA